MNINIGIVVLNWNNYKKTKQCIESILPQIELAHFNTFLFLIDNDSQDGSGERLKKRFNASLDYYNTGLNSGYTGGNNFGIKKALQESCDYILILNNDLTIENIKELIDSALMAFNEKTDIGVVGFDINKSWKKNTPLKINYSDFIFNKLLKITPTQILSTNTLTIQNVRSVCGCAIFFRSTCLSEIGLFDESFFMYAEEHDICLRALRHDWLVVKIYNEKTRINRPIDPISEKQLIWCFEARNILTAYKKNLHGFTRLIFVSIQLAIYAKKIIYFYMQGERKISLKILKGVFSGITGKQGCK